MYSTVGVRPFGDHQYVGTMQTIASRDGKVDHFLNVGYVHTVPLSVSILAFKVNVIICIFAAFVACSTQGLFVPTSSKTIGGVADDSVQVLATEVYRIGIIVAVFPMGYWSDTYGDQDCIVASALLAIVGSGLFVVSSYSFIDDHSLGWEWVFILARFILGCSAGCVVVVESHVCRITEKPHRFFYLMCLVLGQYLGLVLTPIPSLYGKQISPLVEFPYINGYSFPAWILIGLNIILAIVTVYVFEAVDPDRFIHAMGPSLISYRGGKVNTHTVYIYMLVSFSSRGLIEMAEIIGIRSFPGVLSDSVSALYFSIILLCGLICIGILWYMSSYIRQIPSREQQLLSISLIIFVVGSLVEVLNHDHHFAASLFDINGVCDHVGSCIPTLFLLGSVTIWSIAYPVFLVSLLSTFSKIEHNGRLGVQFGSILASSIAGQELFPLLANWISLNYGIGISFFLSLVLTIVGIALFFKHGKMLESYEKKYGRRHNSSTSFDFERDFGGPGRYRSHSQSFGSESYVYGEDDGFRFKPKTISSNDKNVTKRTNAGPGVTLEERLVLATYSSEEDIAGFYRSFQ